MADIVMPQLGESVTEGTITRWFKQVGEHGRRGRAALRGVDRQGRHRGPVRPSPVCSPRSGCRRATPSTSAPCSPCSATAPTGGGEGAGEAAAPAAAPGRRGDPGSGTRRAARSCGRGAGRTARTRACCSGPGSRTGARSCGTDLRARSAGRRRRRAVPARASPRRGAPARPRRPSPVPVSVVASPVTTCSPRSTPRQPAAHPPLLQRRAPRPLLPPRRQRLPPRRPGPPHGPRRSAPLVPGSGDRVESLNNIRRLHRRGTWSRRRRRRPTPSPSMQVDYEGVERVRRVAA